MTVDGGGSTMGGPSSVGDGALVDEGFVGVDGGLGDELAESSNFSNLLEENDLAFGITVDPNT